MRINKAPLFILTLLIFFSCGNSYVLSPEQLEDVLVDLHLVEGMALSESASFPTSEDKLDIYTSVYAKHGVDRALFDSSMTYYSENLGVLSEVYENVYNRIVAFEEEVRAGDFALSSTLINKESYAKMIKEDMALLPYVKKEVWGAARSFNYEGATFENDKTFSFSVDTIAATKMEMRYTLTTDSLESAQCIVTMHYTGNKTEDKTFDLAMDSARMVMHDWSVADSVNKITVKFEADPMNKNAVLNFKDMRMYALSPEAHNISLFN